MTSTVAIFGGSFNPPHVAHQMVCLYVLETCEVDALWMVPTYRHPFRKELCDYADRVRMCELAVRGLADRVTVSRIEQQLDHESSRTLHTLEALAERQPDTQLRLVVGADILAERDKWYRWDEIERLAPPIIVGRAGFPSDIGFEMPEVSSTDVRRRLNEGTTVAGLVPRLVVDYINERGLYRLCP